MIKLKIIFILLFLFIVYNLYNLKEEFDNYEEINHDLNLIFKSLINYVIIRRSSEFPKITQGSDIDILTTDLEKNHEIVNKLDLKYFTKKKSFQNNNINK